ncbi:gluconate 2-dehydrogenase subunit 3-like protein [Prosthecobacter fusiformis]|uniref:Gluconate 2-dehydrogenase subunit 3-like protein n=1 Tax=Prosthecobacter fusiformis TaxID=48464 RepID=A0A4R7SRW9_9BACT|nr:gluconate 2-dehydrogenase subunit 3 family protein [Prosthecobacter fusiformis]TDU80927.1 gluconate 2-dehydrogenase subunit 3-like protein [Prosthecobacter fusiformis]
MIPPTPSPLLDRRTAIQWMLTAAATLTVRDHSALAAETPGATASARLPAKGYGPDPSMVKFYLPGDVWPLTFTESQRRTATALCDVIMPADETSPAASTVGVPAFMDEWVSSPYPGQKADRALILEGLDWIEAEAQKRFKTSFADLQAAQHIAICDDISQAQPKPEFKKAASFFKRYRDLTAGGYYTTPEGMKDIGYRGNIPQATFDGPPIEALRHVGLA